MPSITENIYKWNGIYQWPQNGDEWSEPWSSAYAQWRYSVFPRIEALLDAEVVLEIGPGYGRWTQFLHSHCKRLILVDLSPQCVDACRKRFSNVRHIEYVVNDGTSLDILANHSIDFVFSFDSLVHADSSVLGQYLAGLTRKLKPGASGFIHHSNLGSYKDSLPPNSAFDEHWRSRDVTAELFRNFCASSGMHCFRQELVDWLATGRLLDCFSWFTNEAADGPSCDIRRNPLFMNEAVLATADYHYREVIHGATKRGLIAP